MGRVLKNLFFGIIYISGIWLLVRFFNRHKVAILMYHGVCERDVFLWTQLPITEFENQIDYVRRRYQVADLDQAVAMLTERQPVSRYALVITFDDGFKNNKTLAYPVLKKHNLPSTIYLTTSLVDHDGPFGGLIRTDYVLGLFRNTSKVSLDLGDCGLWNVELGDREKKTMAGYRVFKALKRLDHNEQNNIIQLIAERLGDGVSSEDQKALEGMTWDDAKSMLAEGLVAFGAHTLSHEILTRVPADLMEREIRVSRDIIQERLQTPARHFAYPNGTADDFNNEIRNVVAGHYDSSMTSIEGLNSAGCDVYQLRRIGIGNDTRLWKFKLELSGTIALIHGIRDKILSRS